MIRKTHAPIRLFQGILIFIVSIGLTIRAGAQTSRFSGEVSPVGIGNAIANLGIGVGAPYDGANGGFGFKLAAEYGIWQVGPGIITLGPEIGISISSNYHSVYNYSYGYRGRTFIVAARSAYHYGWGIAGLDTYGGFAFGPGFHHRENKTTGEKDNSSFPVFGAFAGASYFINPQFGFNAEVGFDITNIQVGVVVKLQ